MGWEFEQGHHYCKIHQVISIHVIWVAIVTPTDRPKSVRSRCVIEVFGGVFVVSPYFLDFSGGLWAFVIGLNQICFFFACSEHNKSN